MGHRFESVQQVRDGLKGVHYLADDGIAGVAFLADRLGKPVLVEGPAGTGKTQLAKSIAEMTGARLIQTMANSLQFHDKHLGLIALCVGGGQGMAMIIERLSE